MRENCDMCGTEIKNSRCPCGVWKDKDEMEKEKIAIEIRKSLEEFHEMKRFSLTADIPHLGCAVVFFRGDYKDCEKALKFIYEMKGRKYYCE